MALLFANLEVVIAILSLTNTANSVTICLSTAKCSNVENYAKMNVICNSCNLAKFEII
jgi:hypothetical protein